MNRLRLLILTIVVILALSACDDFFPSKSSVDRVTLTPTSVFMKIGDTQQFTASALTVGGTATDVTGTATWSSSNDGVASVSPDTRGLVTANGPTTGLGSATITASSGGASGSTTVTVSSGTLTSITVGPTNPVLTPGADLQLTADGNFGSTTQRITNLVTWTTSDPNIATVSSSGLARAVATTGQVTFTATANITGGGTVTDTLTVTLQQF